MSPYRDAAAAIDIDGGEALADRLRSAVIPDPVKPIDGSRL